MYVKNPLSENMSTRLRMYKVLLFKFRRHLCKGSIANRKQANLSAIQANLTDIQANQSAI